MNSCKRPLSREDIPKEIPYSDDISILSTPIKIGSKTVPNRICYQPMEGCDGSLDGAPGDLTRRRYLRFAKGGAGLIWFEATAIVPEGRANPRQLYLTRENAGSFSSLIRDIKETCIKENGYEPLIICQLTHSGRWSKPNGKSEPMIAYNKPIFEKDSPLPGESIVSDEYLDSLVEKYVESAKLCEEVGFDGVDVKACHGYLLSELLNSYLREGRHGGCYENRTRLFLDSVKAVKESTKEGFIVASRFNAFDGYPYPYGFGDSGRAGIPDLTEAKRLAHDLKERGASLLNVTMGCPYTNHEVNRPTILAKEEMPYVSIKRMLEGARAVSEAAEGVAVVCSAISFLGAFAPNVVAEGISLGDFAFAGFGRQTFSYPNLARDIVHGGEMKRSSLCLTCGKCTELMRAGKTPGCVIYDREIYTKLYAEMKK